MMDFWEMIGRMVTDKAFFTDLMAFPMKTYHLGSNQRASIPADPASGSAHNDYSLLRQIVQPRMPDVPLSLMALGEMLWGLTNTMFRQKAEVVSVKIGKLNLPQPQDHFFYVALGLMILDDDLRADLINDKWDQLGFRLVNPVDRTTLKSFMDINLNPDMVDTIRMFCHTLWPSECNDKLKEWTQHTHPVGDIS